MQTGRPVKAGANRGKETMYQCPHCGQPAMTALRKTFLGPGAPVPCRSCKKEIKIGFQDWLKAAWPGGALMAAALFVDSDLAVYGLSLAGLALMIGLHLTRVPLVKE